MTKRLPTVLLQNCLLFKTHLEHFKDVDSALCISIKFLVTKKTISFASQLPKLSRRSPLCHATCLTYVKEQAIIRLHIFLLPSPHSPHTDRCAHAHTHTHACALSYCSRCATALIKRSKAVKKVQRITRKKKDN